ncbi:hypothetical protein [Micromonospora siamensis]|uniref:Uncharacterized protein n=1 Tax=Micromonospora siamensis TaxID=299152 RepID=A0A1C5J3D4_9ACTN|nr:hypothetical protein [Micromonospora siamensis]SCG65102.1 hypothetical protein GA0074704_4079 [Micromonospora siamensis]
MRTVGFFRELGPDPAEVYAESIHDHLGAAPLPDTPRVVQYLREGHGLIDVMGAEPDVLGSDRRLVGGASVMTDGEWIWRDDLSFYLATYQVSLSREFVESVRANHYQVPQLQIDELRAASREAMRILGYHRPPAPTL